MGFVGPRKLLRPKLFGPGFDLFQQRSSHHLVLGLEKTEKRHVVVVRFVVEVVVDARDAAYRFAVPLGQKQRHATVLEKRVFLFVEALPFTHAQRRHPVGGLNGTFDKGTR